MATQAFHQKYNSDSDHKFSLPTPKISKYWIVTIVLWAVTVFVIILLVILWKTGVIFQCPKQASKEADDSAPDSSIHPLEASILKMPEYNTLMARRSEDLNLSEKRVIEQLNKEVSTEVLSSYNNNNNNNEIYEQKVVAGLERFIQHVLYIDAHENREHIEKQIENLGLLNSVVTKERLLALKRTDGNMGQFFSHIACLSKALTLQKNVLILEDDFIFHRDACVIYKALQDIEAYNENRWDVICFGFVTDEWQPLTTTQSGKLCRIYHATSLSGYLVNKLYVPRLLSFWLQKARILLKQNVSNGVTEPWAQTALQKSDVWLGLHIPFGYKKDLGIVRYLDDLQYQVSPQVQKIHLHTPFIQKSIAICHILGEEARVATIQQDCYLKFLKNHRLVFFWFTDRVTEYQVSRTAEGAILHMYPILDQTNQILQAQDVLLKHCDYVFYMDTNYRIYQHPVEAELLVSGLVATEQLHNLVLPPDTQKKYALSFHGGDTSSYLKMCQVLKENRQADPQHDLEFYFQRYLEQNPPVSVLSQNYIFSERCIDLDCQEPMCQVLREAMLYPIMGPTA
jgi:hypothetical protein